MKTEFSRVVNCSADKAFHLISDFAGAPHRLSVINKIEPLSENLHSVGSRWREYRIEAGREIITDWNVVELNEDQTIELAGNSQGIQFNCRLDFKRIGLQTRIVESVEIKQASLLHRALAPLHLGGTKRLLQRLESDLNESCRLCEAFGKEATASEAMESTRSHQV